MRIRNIKNLLKGGKEWLKLLSSLLLAFFIWCVHSLSQEYSTYFHFTLDVTSSLEGRTSNAESIDKIIFSGKATGFYIVKHRLRKNPILRVGISPDLFVEENKDKDIFSLSCSEIQGDISLALVDEVVVENIISKELFFEFPAMSHKKVPVVASMDVECDNQYMIPAKPILIPDSVVVYGKDKNLLSIDSVYTDVIYYTDLSRSVKGAAKLVPISNVRFSEVNILYDIEVVRYVEEVISVPVKVINVPDNKELLAVPERVNLRYRKVFEDKKEFDEKDFVCQIDYNNYNNSINSKLVPTLIKMPESILNISLEPIFVDCILIDK